ncbi:MAG TPA: outer membrane protein assembly factor BamD [Blastocatellia bacterium]|nr:outer membrane protein assembly factor BamD [Blastocatellia bacterium]
MNMRSIKTATSKASVVLTALCILAIAVTVFGCGWGVGSDHSVRFNPYRNETEFGRLPPLPKYGAEAANKLFSWHQDVAYDWELEEKTAKSIDKLWETAAAREADGRLGDLRRCLSEYLQRTAAERSSRWNRATDVQKRRNSAIDKLDALGELDRGASQSAVAEYLAARTEYDGACRPDEVLRHLSLAREEFRLRDNGDYLQAALSRDDLELAADGFERLAHIYPHSEKREAALYMSAVLKMKSSESYKYQHDGRALKDPCVDCRDKAWKGAQQGFERVIREYPKGRYRADARGWLGYLSGLVGDKAQALCEYYRLLSESDHAGRVEALFSLCLVRHRADDSAMDRVEKALEREPAAALAYAYHNIYNYAFGPKYERDFYEDGDDEGESDDEPAGQASPGQKRELARVASFATRMMNKFSSSSLTAGFVVRVAEADLELGREADASALARRALRMGAVGDIRAEALWIAGVSEFRRRRYSTARQALVALIAEHRNDRYTEGARRQLAMLEEDTGNIEAALDQYLALDYRHDVAYFVDVLLTPEQLAAFIERRPGLANRDELQYSLGIRYLRDRRWDEARSAFAKVKPLGRDVDSSYQWTHQEYNSRYEEEKEPPKLQDCDPKIRGVRRHWIDQDVRTANDLEALERRVEGAPDDESRAEALYQVASYEFERSLLFYNPLAWHGQRHYLLVDLDERGAFRQPNESQVLFDHMQRHDMAANSLAIFLEVARRFPNTRAARDALYTAAVCHERLADYNGYWRAVYDEGGHAGERMVAYGDVRAAYPEYRFPRGTVGWEPSTRTVEGGPGWEKPPRPKPRPSKWARAVKLADSWVSEGFKFLNRALTDLEFLLKQGWLGIVSFFAFVGHCFWVLAMCGWLWFLWRRMREARVLMDEALARSKPRPAEERLNQDTLLAVTPSVSVMKRYLNQDMRARWLEIVYDLEYKIHQIVGEKRGISLVAFYAASHALFAVLLVRLLVNW